jgi:hypothetical protein
VGFSIGRNRGTTVVKSRVYIKAPEAQEKNLFEGALK